MNAAYVRPVNNRRPPVEAFRMSDAPRRFDRTMIHKGRKPGGHELRTQTHAPRPLTEIIRSNSAPAEYPPRRDTGRGADLPRPADDG